MLKDSDLAGLSHAIYGGPAGFTKYFPEEGFGICCAVLLNADENIVAFRGTVPTELQNWLQDLMAYPAPYKHATFGSIHLGAFCGLPDIMAEIVPLLNLSVKTTFCGHSLGSQRAALAGAIMLDATDQPDMIRVVGMAGPAPGFDQFLQFMSKVEWRNYRNAAGFFGDPVPLLAFNLPPAFAYKNVALTHVTAQPGGFLDLKDAILTDWHNSQLYVKGVTAYEAAAPVSGVKP
jgi:pimeloyl-ACP methyl ester carboxylesterase